MCNLRIFVKYVEKRNKVKLIKLNFFKKKNIFLKNEEFVTIKNILRNN